MSEHPLQLRAAYSVCRHIARSAAKNFYYGFLVLPARKRNALSAVYAFMRHADDISDDLTVPVEQRREKLDEWMNAFRRVAAGERTDDPVLLALADTQKTFNIPSDLLEKLVYGTAMDLQTGASGTLHYETFDQLYDYCYHVASVVGLVCIRIFGYRDPRAEELAEKTGIAFQLTNILRDVKEDSQMGRVYLPCEDFRKFGLDAGALNNGTAATAMRPLLEFEADRARKFYHAADDLLPLIDDDSQPALWTLVEIYRRLLKRIAAQNYDVFSQRVQLSSAEKVGILAKGLRAPPYMSAPNQMQAPRVAVIGGGLAGISAGCALADAGYHVELFERRPYLGGRASSYELPGTGEVVDNCQHVLLGCCTNLIDFYHRLGVEDQIRWYDEITFILPGGKSSILKPNALPAPFHSSASFWASSVLDFNDKLAISRALLALMPALPSDNGESFESWLTQHGQTKHAIDRFWAPVLVSALNDDLDRISLPYAALVFRDSFLKSAEAGRMGVPAVPLSQLYGHAASYIEARGGRVHLRASVDSIQANADAIRICAGGDDLAVDYAVLATPFNTVEKLLPDVPEMAPLREQAGHFGSSPITGIHLWFDREITPLEHAVLLERTIQWMFQKSKILNTRRESGEQGSYLELVVSSSKSLVDKPRQEIIDLAVRELAEFFPAVRDAKLTKATVVKEVHATFSPAPGSDAYRPSHTSPWPRLFLAGDWTATGWPSTMEGAVRSGYGAAEALTTTRGENSKFLIPDLPPQGLMRLFG